MRTNPLRLKENIRKVNERKNKIDFEESIVGRFCVPAVRDSVIHEI
jgi:hypothetical protein